MIEKRTYECRAKLTNGLALCLTSEVKFDKSMKIKEVEAELREDAAREFSKGSFVFSAKDIKLKRVA